MLSKEEVADTIVENFNKADEIVEEDVRLISNENLETITNEIKEGELEVEEDDSETTTVPLTTTATTEASKLSVHEILLISFSCFFEALFVAATIYFVIMGKKSSSLAAGAISVLIRKYRLFITVFETMKFKRFSLLPVTTGSKAT